MSYEKDDGPLTEEQVSDIQKIADDNARENGITPPSEIPDGEWKFLL